MKIEDGPNNEDVEMWCAGRGGVADIILKISALSRLEKRYILGEKVDAVGWC